MSTTKTTTSLMPKTTSSSPIPPKLNKPDELGVLEEFEIVDEMTDLQPEKVKRFPDPYRGKRVQPVIEKNFGQNNIDAKDSSVIGFYNQGSKRDSFRGLSFRRYFTYETNNEKELIGSWLTKWEPKYNCYNQYLRPHFRH
ncbi:Oidioi.mRNA.OKI2018_I69.XSR.g15669.t1.cds [Oikopleura dioica]|uniref:Oidioi.mRNA.OKI2018_I69.XSR.g15669.t1.cds n=1 Tax=Oikopleura dioica TaxID=34765 RepID=A0ABN7SIQ5_OIKDI|nr:Oidioi.mRNA.OKI2018_I69.XSR.g15669.t1.cds [Oikopleura dioica]